MRGLAAAVIGAGCAALSASCHPRVVDGGEVPRVLVMSRTAGYRHDSIAAGIEAITAVCRCEGLGVVATEDASVFSRAGLEPYAVVVFLNTTGDILDESQQAALESFVRGGGGFVGIHAAADTEYDWPWYGKLVGARFAGHGPVEPGTVRVVDGSHPSMRHLPDRWARDDEWYAFRDVRPGLRVLARLELEGDQRPIAWCHDFDAGRAWYTAGGHTIGSYTEPLFVEHLAGGIVWAAGRKAISHMP